MGSPRARVRRGFAAYFRFVTHNRSAFLILFGASARNDAEFAAVVDSVVSAAADAVSQLIRIQTSPEHLRSLAHAVVGVAEALSRQALAEQATTADFDRLTDWASELLWSGLRGVRPQVNG